MGERLRVDKWLWYARFAKTRGVAQALAVSGHVRVNRAKIDSASHPLKIGDVLTIALPRGVVVVRVDAFGTRRGPASEARTLYSDLTPPSDAGSSPPSPVARSPKPDKRERRRLAAFKSSPEDI